MARPTYDVRLKDGRILGSLTEDRIRIYIINKIAEPTSEIRTSSSIEAQNSENAWLPLGEHPVFSQVLTINKNELGETTRVLHRQQLKEFTEQDVHESDPDKTKIRSKEKLDTEFKELENQDLPIYEVSRDDQRISQESTQFVDTIGLRAQSSEEVFSGEPSMKPSGIRKPPSFLEKHLQPRTIGFIAVIAGLWFALDFFSTPSSKNVAQKEKIEFLIKLPQLGRHPANPARAQILLKEGLRQYALDSPISYLKASKKFSEAIEYHSDLGVAYSLLASCYINLFDYLKKDEHYFRVITGLVETARAKNPDLLETVISDVEYEILFSKYDSAIERIVEFSKLKIQQGQNFGSELFLYLGLLYYKKNQFNEALQALQKIPEEQWFSVKIPLTLARIFLNQNNLEMASGFYRKALLKSPNHWSAELEQADVLMRLDRWDQMSALLDQTKTYLGELPSSLRAKYYVEKARMALKDKNLDLARSYYAQARKLDQDSSEIALEYYTTLSYLGKIKPELRKQAHFYELLAQSEKMYHEEKWDDALALYLQARDMDPQNTIPLVRIAEIFEKKHDSVSSLQSLARALKIKPTDLDINKKYVDLLISSYEFKEAHETLKKMSHFKPSLPSWELDFYNGSLFLKKDRLVESRAYFKRSLNGGILKPELYLLYAQLQFKLGLYSDAQFFYGLAHAYIPNNISTIYGVALCIAEKDGTEKAIQYLSYERQRASQQLTPDLFALESKIYLHKGDLTRALSVANGVLEKIPNHLESLKTKYKSLIAQESYKRALDAIQAYLAVQAMDPEVYLDRHKVFLKLGQRENAIKDLIRVTELFPAYPGVHTMIGELERLHQHYEDALLRVQMELEKNPDFTPAYTLRARVALEKNDPAFALKEATKVLSTDPADVPALLVAGQAHRLLKSYVASKAMFEKALQIDSGNPEIYKQFGFLMFDMGAFADGQKYLKTYLELFPNASDREEIGRKIASQK